MKKLFINNYTEVETHIKSKTDRELQEYIAMTQQSNNEYLNRLTDNIVFFFWVFIASFTFSFINLLTSSFR